MLAWFESGELAVLGPEDRDVLVFAKIQATTLGVVHNFEHNRAWLASTGDFKENSTNWVDGECIGCLWFQGQLLCILAERPDSGQGGSEFMLVCFQCFFLRDVARFTLDLLQQFDFLLVDGGLLCHFIIDLRCRCLKSAPLYFLQLYFSDRLVRFVLIH